MSFGREKGSSGRPLQEDDLEKQLHQKIDTDYTPIPPKLLKHFNSTFIEVVDSGFQWAGIGTTVVMVFIGMIVYHWNFIAKMWVINIFVGPILIAMWFLILWIECFRWTHYPARLNRKNGYIYSFNVKGGITAVKWDDVFFKRFVPNAAESMAVMHISALVLDSERTNVIEIFSLGGQVETERELLSQWEFIRQYMEDGPSEIAYRVEGFRPILDRRETFLEGLSILMSHFEGIWYWILLPFGLCVSIGRWLAMRTCRVPKWPKELEEECVIEDGDPYCKG